jgi:hypothetical protein
MVGLRPRTSRLFQGTRRLSDAIVPTQIARGLRGDGGLSRFRGIIIRPGDLKFGQPTFSSEGGNALVPIQ